MRSIAIAIVLAACGGNAAVNTPGGDAGVDPTPDGNAPDGAAGSGVDVAFSQPAYAFGRLAANITRTPGSVAIVNTGTVATELSLAITDFAIVATDCTGVVLQPGDGCTVSVDPTATTLGPTAGSLEVTAGSVVKSATLSATLEGAVSSTSSGGGTVTAAPAPDDCGGIACYAAGTIVTFTGSPDATSYLMGWSDPACGTDSTCIHTVDEQPFAVAATFAPLTATFTVEIDGPGLGSVQIYRGDYDPIATCTATCTVEVDHTISLTIVAQTPDDFVTFSAPCSPGNYVCDLPAGTTSATATFQAVAGEVDLFPLSTPGVVYSIDFSPTGEVVLGTSQGVLAFDAALAPRWTSPLVGAARFATDGGVFVGTTTSVVKLDSSGATLWTHASSVVIPSVFGFIQHRFAATPGGGVAILPEPAGGEQPLELVDAGGDTIAQVIGGDCLAAGADGTIYVGFGYGDTPVQTFTASGQPVTTLPNLDANDSGDCALAVGTTQLAFSEPSNLQEFMGYLRATLDGLIVDGRATGRAEPMLGYWATGVAFDGDDNLFWYHPVVAPRGDAPYSGADLLKITPTGAVVWSIHRPSFPENGLRGGWAGLDIYDVATAPDGRSAIAGVYHDVDGGVSFVDRAIVEIFPP